MSKFKEQFCQFIDTNAKTLSKILKDINQAKMEKVIKIGTCGSADTFRAVQKVLDAYNLPNEALNNGEIDLNSFQHKAYLENECKKQGHDLTTIGDTSSAPFTLYSKNVGSLEALKTLAGEK